MLRTYLNGLLLLVAATGCSGPVQRPSVNVSAQPPPPEEEPVSALDMLFESSPELSDFVVVDSEPGLQIEPTAELWIRQGAKCSAMARADTGWTQQLLVCESDEQPAARCAREATVQNNRFTLSSLVTCERSLPDGSGEGWAHTAAAERLGDLELELIAVSPETYELGRIYRALALPREVTIVEEPCLPGTRERAFAEHGERFPHLTTEAVESAVLQTHSVYPSIEGRFCRRIEDWRIWVHEAGDHPGCLGADEEHRDVAVDCSQPCPETEASRRMHEAQSLLRPLRLRRRATDVVLYRSEAACQAAEETGLLDVADADSCSRP